MMKFMEFVNKEMDNVVLSLDGRKKFNDQMRPFRKGKGSYDLIVPKFQKLAESRNQDKYYVVVHLQEIIWISPMISCILQILDSNRCRLSRLLEMQVIRMRSGRRYSKIMEEYDKLAKMMIEREKEGKGFNFFHFMIDLDGGPCVAKRLSGCGSGTEYLAVTPWGDFYPCHQFVGNEDFLMGNVDDGIKRQILTILRAAMCIPKKNAETVCKILLQRWMCMANSYNFHGTIHDTYEIGCEMQRKRVECAIMMKAALADEE